MSSVASNSPNPAQAASAAAPKAAVAAPAKAATTPAPAATPTAPSTPAVASQLREAPLTQEQIKHNNRMASGLQALGGAAEIVFGVGFTVATGGVGGALGGGAAVLDGSMRLTHAVMDMIDGEHTSNTISTAAQIAGVDVKTADRIDAGVGIAAGLVTGGLGLKAAMQATTNLTRITGGLVAANSVETTARGIHYVAGGEQTKSTVNHVADALGATSPVANAYTSLALSTALGGPSMVLAMQKAKAARAAAQAEARNAQAGNGTTAGTATVTAAPAATTTASTAATTPPASTPPAPSPAAAPAVVTATGSTSTKASSTSAQPQKLEDTIDLFLKEAGEVYHAGPDGPRKTFESSITRQLSIRDALGASDTVRLRAKEVEKSFNYGSSQPGPAQSVGDVKRYGEALAFAIANNPVAYTSWKRSVLGERHPASQKDPIPGKLTISTEPHQGEYGVTSLSLHKRGDAFEPTPISIHHSLDPANQFNNTILGRMYVFVHESRHADTDQFNVVGYNRSKTRAIDEYRAESRALMALLYEKNKQSGTPPSGPRLPPVLRAQVGNWVPQTYGSDVAYGPRPHRYMAPEAHRDFTNRATATRNSGFYTLLEAQVKTGELYQKANKIRSSLSKEDLAGSSEGVAFNAFVEELKTTSKQMSDTYDDVVGKTTFATWGNLSDPSKLTIKDLAKSEARLLRHQEAIKAMQARPAELRHDVFNAEMQRLLDIQTGRDTTQSGSSIDLASPSSQTSDLQFPTIIFPSP